MTSLPHNSAIGNAIKSRYNFKEDLVKEIQVSFVFSFPWCIFDKRVNNYKMHNLRV